LAHGYYSTQCQLYLQVTSIIFLNKPKFTFRAGILTTVCLAVSTFLFPARLGAHRQLGDNTFRKYRNVLHFIPFMPKIILYYLSKYQLRSRHYIGNNAHD